MTAPTAKHCREADGNKHADDTELVDDAELAEHDDVAGPANNDEQPSTPRALSRPTARTG